jgi:hypothetical protein
MSPGYNPPERPLHQARRFGVLGETTNCVIAVSMSPFNADQRQLFCASTQTTTGRNDLPAALATIINQRRIALEPCGFNTTKGIAVDFCGLSVQRHGLKCQRMSSVRSNWPPLTACDRGRSATSIAAGGASLVVVNFVAASFSRPPPAQARNLRLAGSRYEVP